MARNPNVQLSKIAFFGTFKSLLAVFCQSAQSAPIFLLLNRRLQNSDQILSKVQGVTIKSKCVFLGGYGAINKG